MAAVEQGLAFNLLLVQVCSYKRQRRKMKPALIRTDAVVAEGYADRDKCLAGSDVRSRLLQ